MASSSLRSQFERFRDNLDDYNDRRERLIKVGRDVTTVSKRAIFLLHRVILEDPQASVDDPSLRKKAAAAGYNKLRDVQTLFATIHDELAADPTAFWRYERQVSPGVQEYIEALSFAHYLDHDALISYDQVKHCLLNPQGVPYFHLTLSDYLLGVSDLTGELMRFAISTISRRGGRTNARKVCAFVRHCKADLERLTPYVRELKKKQAVTAQSLEKIEDAAYAIIVRSSEYDLPPEMLDDIVAETIADFQSGAAATSTRRRRGGNKRDLDNTSDNEVED